MRFLLSFAISFALIIAWCGEYAIAIYFSFLRMPFSTRREIINTNGKMHPASIPFFKSLFAFWVILPTSAGPNAPPKSPAVARNANMAVPPPGSRLEQMLMEPGHIIPTENPHIMQPISPRRGLSEMDASM